jgi:DNA-binding MarR family transcriptional regulator
MGLIYRNTTLLRRATPDGGRETRMDGIDDADEPGLSPAQYVAIAAFRHRLRRFLAFSASAAGEAGLPPQQHQALLAIAGHQGEAPPSVGLLAEQLLIAPHTAAELASRMVSAGLMTKAPSEQDRRRVELALTPKARALLERLTAAHLRELKSLEPELIRSLSRLTRKAG